jgi:hypothetical protein
MLHITYKTQTVDTIPKNNEHKLLLSYLWDISYYSTQHCLHIWALTVSLGPSIYLLNHFTIRCFITLSVLGPLLNLWFRRYQTTETKVPLCFIKHHPIKMYGEMYVWLHAFITSVLGWDEWQTSCRGRSTSCMLCIGGCMGPRSSLDDIHKIKIFCPY